MTDRLLEIRDRLDAALKDSSFYLRVNSWLTAGDGRQFCASAPDDIMYLLEQIDDDRSRSAKMIKVLRFYASAPPGTGLSEGVINGGEFVPLGTMARQAIAEYEASRD